MSAMDVPPGTVVEYFSASMNKWIPARVLRPGKAPGTLDLDCKDAVDVTRVRRAQSSAPPGVAPTQPKLGVGPAAPAASGGPLGLQAGDFCFYKSSAHGWIPATAVRFRPDEQTYDLDVKQQAGTDKIHCIQDGSLIEYLSTSTNQWIMARVLRKGQNPGNFDLDCKAGVHISRLRPAEGNAAAPLPAAPDGMRHSSASSNPGHYGAYSPTPPPHWQQEVSTMEQVVSPTARHPKMQQLRQALDSQDPIELRQRMESRSALNLVGEELNQANHALWVMEARPEALRDLKRAVARNDITELQAALEAAAVVGVEDRELETASLHLFALQAKMWRYDAGDGRHMDLRKEPKIDGPRVRQRLNAGDVFEVAEESRGSDGITYLRLADGRGWAFNHKPGIGTMCVKQYAEEEARRAQSGNQPISLTIANLRSVHQNAMKPAANPGLGAIREDEDSPGPYVIIEKTAVTPGLALCTDVDIVTTLNPGTTVDVLEVAHRAETKRVRGRIRNPRGWISLLDTKTGKRWAEQQSY